MTDVELTLHILAREPWIWLPVLALFVALIWEIQFQVTSHD